jgi:hypothetical protein
MCFKVVYASIDINVLFFFSVLTPYERGTLYCRIGWLKMWNPLKPEGSWELDLGHHEERVVAKMLCVLSAQEPGMLCHKAYVLYIFKI